MATAPEIKPNPDPSVMTTEQLDRAIQSLKNEFKIQFDGVETRFRAIDEATRLVHDDLVRVPTDVQKVTGAIRELVEQEIKTATAQLLTELREAVARTEERFIGVANQFGSNDKALTAALQAQEKQAIATNDSNTAASQKQEAAFTKQIDQLGQVMNATNNGLNDKLDDAKQRLQVLETQSRTIDRGSDKSMSVIGTTIAAVVGFVVIMGGLIGIVAFVMVRH